MKEKSDKKNLGLWFLKVHVLSIFAAGSITWVLYNQTISYVTTFLFFTTLWFIFFTIITSLQLLWVWTQLFKTENDLDQLNTTTEDFIIRILNHKKFQESVALNLIRVGFDDQGTEQNPLGTLTTLCDKHLKNMAEMEELRKKVENLHSLLFNSTIQLSEIVRILWNSRGKDKGKRFELSASEACGLRRLTGTYALQATQCLNEDEVDSILKNNWSDAELIEDILQAGHFREGNPLVISLRERVRQLRTQQPPDTSPKPPVSNP